MYICVYYSVSHFKYKCYNTFKIIVSKQSNENQYSSVTNARERTCQPPYFIF